MSKRRPVKAMRAVLKSPPTLPTDMLHPIEVFLLLAKPLEGIPDPAAQIIFLEYVARFASLGWITPTNDNWGDNTWAITAKGHAEFNKFHTKH